VAAAGVALGLACALVAAQCLQPLLFQTSARDPAVYAGVALVLIAVAFAASVGPGVRAGRTDPLDALRTE